jgi:hypothetical protein
VLEAAFGDLSTLVRITRHVNAPVTHPRLVNDSKTTALGQSVRFRTEEPLHFAAVDSYDEGRASKEARFT